MKILSLLFIGYITIVLGDDSTFPVEKDVIVLTDDSFDKASKKYNYLMSIFYSPECDVCKMFLPEYEKAASVLKKENLYLSKVDCSEQKKLSSKYEIKEFPTLKLFKKGKIIDYKGNRKDEDIINWMREVTKPEIKKLESKEEIEKCISGELCIIYFGSNKTNLEEYTKAARKLEDYKFYLVESQELITNYSKPEMVVLYKQFAEKKNELFRIKSFQIIDFVKEYSTPKVKTLENVEGRIILKSQIPALILFANPRSEKWKEFEKIMNNTLEKVFLKMKVYLTDIGVSSFSMRTAEFLDINYNNLPCIVIIDPKIHKKYKMESEINETNIFQFIENWEKGLINPYLMSEEEPKENNGDVRIVVGKTFEKEVLQNDKDVLLLFYSRRGCRSCEIVEPKFRMAAKDLKEYTSDIIMAEIDGRRNDFEGSHDVVFPSIKFYPGNKKEQPPINFNVYLTVPEIFKFIEEKTGKKYELKKKEKEKDNDKTPDL